MSDDEGEQEMLVEDISDLEDMMIKNKYEEIEQHHQTKKMYGEAYKELNSYAKQILTI